jgi:hypothetical protein
MHTKLHVRTNQQVILQLDVLRTLITLVLRTRYVQYSIVLLRVPVLVVVPELRTSCLARCLSFDVVFSCGYRYWL